MNILAFAATNSRQSIDRTLIGHAAGRLRQIAPTTQIETLNPNDHEIPIYSIDRERADGIPGPARDFFARIGAAYAVLVSFAEHNGFVTATWKNAFDWMSRIEMKLWQGKPVAMLAPSPGAREDRGGMSRAEEVAAVAARPLSGEARVVTGSAHVVDGGVTEL